MTLKRGRASHNILALQLLSQVDTELVHLILIGLLCEKRHYMNTLIQGSLLLGAGLLFTLYASSAISQIEDEQGRSQSARYAEREDEGDIPPPPLTTSPPSRPIEPSPSIPASPMNSSPVPSQHTLLSSSTLVGVAVNNAQGEKMGKIREIMIDPSSGQLMYAVVDSVASFGMGKQKSFAVPWQALRVNLDQTEIVVQLDRGLFPILPSVALNK
jgi:sporulation protein YlmC with PRC-barrel domain